MIRPIESAIFAISVLPMISIFAPSAKIQIASKDKSSIVNSLNRANRIANSAIMQQYDSTF